MFKRILTILSLSLLSFTAVAEEYEAGTHYDVINPAIRTADPAKIEAAEFFWYGCGHCYNFEPMLAQWKKTLDEDVNFRGIPAMWGGAMELHAKAYYAARVLKVEDKMDQAIFQALNVDRNPLRSEKEIAELFVANGIEEALPRLIDIVSASGHPVLWTCDPMHGNTEVTEDGLKTRRFENILSELEQAFDIHHACGTILGGVHLELTGENVTECTGGARGLEEKDLHEAYESQVDPRLNAEQALEMAFSIVRKCRTMRSDAH